jgi:enoyl-CoA hydratase/carnithine racemase
MTENKNRALVTTSIDRGVATITLDSPSNRNAMSRQLLAELHAALDSATKPDVRAIVLTHTGTTFCAGADLKERSAASSDGPPDSGPMVQAFERLMACDQPTVAAVRGAVRAGGVGLMASCDLIVVQPDATFAFTEVRIGVAPAIIAVPILRRVNASRLTAPFLTGESFDAGTALDLGLVTHVSDDVDDKVRELCAALLLGAPSALAATKHLLHRVPGMSVPDAFAEMRSLSDDLFSSVDATEGMAAFLDKRTPSWQRADETEESS